MNDFQKLADMLFSHIDKTTGDYEALYPPRTLPEGARVTRFAPSPTGFLHIGGLFTAMVNKRIAEASGGLFFVRIEDTDKKREVEDGISDIIKGLTGFGIGIDEGVLGSEHELGHYGPYQQSRRKEIYQAYVKYLVSLGKAYPCFCTEEELSRIREKQETEKLLPGYYGEFALCRSMSFEQVKSAVESGKPYVIRLKSSGREDKKLVFEDLIKGKIEMPENIQDIVLLKTDGVPTYHFAHAVDDHLMRVTHVIRGEEWLSSMPVHIELFQTLGFKPPKYAHLSPIMVEENGSKRKLSKRKDPEAAADFYNTQGFPRESVTEYLMTISNSNYEDWRRANPREPVEKFPFSLKKMSQSGALFDIAKLTDVSRNTISLMSADQVYDYTVQWAKENNPEIYRLFTEDPDYAKAILSIDRDTPKPRKDIAKWSDIMSYVEYFYDELLNLNYNLPENIPYSDAAEILEAYLSVYNSGDDKDTWFAKIKELCPALGYTANVKEYKKNPAAYKGHVGDVTTVIRIAVTDRINTPDLYAIMRLLGKERVTERLQAALICFTEDE